MSGSSADPARLRGAARGKPFELRAGTRHGAEHYVAMIRVHAG